MKDFSAKLLREKFVIRDLAYADPQDKRASIVALSNRIVVELRDDSGRLSEKFVVRAQNMHSALRMAARIIQTFEKDGPLMVRAKSFDWEEAWSLIVNDYEYRYNAERWIALYYQGNCIFQQGEHHSFLDVIEKCDVDNDMDYDFTIPSAEKLFKQAGKAVEISYNSNVALSTEFTEQQGRCGVISRGSSQTATFTLSVRSRSEPVNISRTLVSAAAFLEGIQLAFLIGFNTERMRIGLVDCIKQERRQTDKAKERLVRLNGEISNLEEFFDVRYRPERPNFEEFSQDAEELAKKILATSEDEDDTHSLLDGGEQDGF